MRLRILSDLHFADVTSRIQSVDGLDPLLDDIDELWLNGDSFDTETSQVPAPLAALQEHLAPRVPQVRYLSGNHDPFVSSDAELSLADGRIWVTHGDVFTPDIVPWGRLRGVFRARIAAIRAEHPELDYETLEDRLRINRRACCGVPRECDPHVGSLGMRLRRFATELFPPRQPWMVLHTWRTFPDSVARLSAIWKPQVRIVITGHIHFPQVWQRGALTVINTGGFTGPMGASVVDVLADRVQVHRLRFRAGVVTLGKLVTEIPLAEPVPLPLSRAT